MILFDYIRIMLAAGCVYGFLKHVKCIPCNIEQLSLTV